MIKGINFMGPMYLKKIIDRAKLLDFTFQFLGLKDKERVVCLEIEEEIPDIDVPPWDLILRWEKREGEYPLHIEAETDEKYEKETEKFALNICQQFKTSLVWESEEVCPIKLTEDGICEYVCLKYEESNRGIIEIDYDFSPCEDDACFRLMGKKWKLES